MARKPEDEYLSPVDRFAQLPEPTRKWLEQLREDDINDIMEVLRTYHEVRSFRRFSKWLVITVVAVFVAAAQFGEAIQKLWGWMRGHG